MAWAISFAPTVMRPRDIVAHGFACLALRGCWNLSGLVAGTRSWQS